MENNNNVVNEKKEEKKITPVQIVLTLVAGVIAIVLLSKVYEFGMNVLYSLVYGEDAEFYGATERITFGKEEEEDDYSVAHDKSYLLENYQVELFNTEAEVYELIEENYNDYLADHKDWFLDYTDIKATQYLNDDMRNERVIVMVLEGQILSIEEGGNVILMQDNILDDNEIYDIASAFDALTCYVDVSMVENKDQLYVGDYIEVCAVMPGKMPMQDGSYSPCIIAFVVEFQ